MLIGKPAPFVSAFVDAVDEVIREHHAGRGMSAIQRTWLGFCVTAILVTNAICWARFERASLGTYSLAALSWIFRYSKIPSHTSVDSFAMSVGPRGRVFAPIAGPHPPLLASPKCPVRKPLHLPFWATIAPPLV